MRTGRGGWIYVDHRVTRHGRRGRNTGGTGKGNGCRRKRRTSACHED